MSTTKDGPKKSPADDLICPITLELPWVPVTAEDGKIYERHAIEEHFKKCASGMQYPPSYTSPLTKASIGQTLFPAPHIKSLIETLIENGVIGGDLATKWNEKMKQQKELEELKKKADGGDSVAMVALGGFYESGEHWLHGITKDEVHAAAWYKKAHEQGNVAGTARMGDFMCTGRGGLTNFATGFMYVGMAAVQGSRFGAYSLGMAMAGIHVGKSIGRRRAKSSDNLRSYHGQINGITVDKKEAIYWLEKAVGDSPDCIDCLNDEATMEAWGVLEMLGANINRSHS